jgi:hypothetical protein
LLKRKDFLAWLFLMYEAVVMNEIWKGIILVAQRKKLRFGIQPFSHVICSYIFMRVASFLPMLVEDANTFTAYSLFQ